MITRSRAALAAFFAAVLCVSLIHNRKLYGPKRWELVVRKSFVDMSFLCMIAISLPILLVAWSGVYVTEHLAVRTWQNRYWIATLAVLVGVGLTALSAFCFEAVALLSVLPVNIVSGRIWQKYQRQCQSN